MNKLIEKTKLFHCKQGFPLNKDLTAEMDRTTRDLLDDIANEMLTSAEMLEGMLKKEDNLRIHRAQLMIEELGETILGLAHNDEIATLDGLSDLNFVTIGTAIAFDLPLIEGLNAICDSNLTKSPRTKDDVRLRNKGSNYCPPNLKQVLSLHRGIKVQAFRTSCMNPDQTREVQVLIKMSVHGEKYYIRLAEGGVTGYESMPALAVPETLENGWCACAGTPSRWDTLKVPAKSMREIQMWLEDVFCSVCHLRPAGINGVCVECR